jgi:hypothetical protein
VKAALDDLLTVAPPDRRAPLETQLELLKAAVAVNDWPEAERTPIIGDPQGIGSGDDVRAPVPQ